MPAYRTRDASARTLEVSTDAPLPPTVSIISPTPRAFTFPINDTRFPTSPSSSPFEPTLKSIPSTPPPIRPFSPTSSIGSDSSLSVLSSPTAPPSSQASSHRRRRSTASDIGERRPKKGDDDYIKRPENAFILFRRKKCEERQAAQEEDDGSSGPIKKQRQADLSKTISQQWKSLPSAERQYWEDLAKAKKKEHEAMYPNYVYRPQRTKKNKPKGKSRPTPGCDTDAESFSFLMPVSSSPTRSLSRDYIPGGHGHGRRAASAPTPPAFQTIQLPTVWMPSCPASPRLVPRISGRSPAPVGHIPPPESAPLTSYDYAPNDDLFMPSYQAPYDGSLQSHPQHQQQPDETYQNMFHISTDNGVVGGPLLHALSIPARSDGQTMMSPADAIASSLVSPADTYASSAMSSVSSHTGPFTPADALHMVALATHQHPQGDVPTDVDPATDGDASEMPLPFGFWPGESLWANMEGLMPEDFNLGSIPPVELGLVQLGAMPAGSGIGCEEGPAGGICPEWMTFDNAPPHEYGAPDPPGGMPLAPSMDSMAPHHPHHAQHGGGEEHDYDDAMTPGGSEPAFMSW